MEIAAMRQAKKDMAEDEYYAKLEPLLLELARIYQKAQETSAKSP